VKLTTHLQLVPMSRKYLSLFPFPPPKKSRRRAGLQIKGNYLFTHAAKKGIGTVEGLPYDKSSLSTTVCNGCSLFVVSKNQLLVPLQHSTWASPLTNPLKVPTLTTSLSRRGEVLGALQYTKLGQLGVRLAISHRRS
jgi:hypothetical protein